MLNVNDDEDGSNKRERTGGESVEQNGRGVDGAVTVDVEHAEESHE